MQLLITGRKETSLLLKLVCQNLFKRSLELSRESLKKCPEVRNWKLYCSVNLLLVISWIPVEIPVSLVEPNSEMGCCNEIIVFTHKNTEGKHHFKEEMVSNYPVTDFFTNDLLSVFQKQIEKTMI